MNLPSLEKIERILTPLYPRTPLMTSRFPLTVLLSPLVPLSDRLRFVSRLPQLAASIAFGLAVVLLPGGVWGQNTFITVDTTYNGTPLTINTPAGLFVSHSSNNPLLTLTNGATTSGVEGVVIGSLSGESGQLLIQSGSTLTNSGDGTSLGTFGSRSVRRGDGYIGLNSDSTGVATVTGSGSMWTNSQWLIVGNSGNGTLNIEAGGLVSNTVGSIGTGFAGSTGVVTVTGSGSTWTNSNSLRVGDGRNGTLNVQNGGQVSNTNFASIGYTTGSTGVATVTGSGSTWTNSGNLSVGRAGNTNGTLNVQNGGLVSNLDGILGDLIGGNGVKSTGVATVTGANSKWINAGGLTVGGDGDGTLNVEDGGQVQVNSAFSGSSIGVAGTSISVATVTGSGSMWINAGGLTVGNSGRGTLNVQNGGQVSNSNGFIGRNSGSIGVATVTGSSSKWTNSGDLILGGNSLTTATNGRGTLTIKDGGTVTVGGTTRIHGGNPNTAINLMTGGTLTTQHFNASGGIFNWSGGKLELTGGSLSGLASVNVVSGATLAGTGTVAGPVNVSNGGRIAPGNSIGQMTVQGNVNLIGALDIEYDIANSTLDLLGVNGLLTLDSNSVLNLSEVNGLTGLLNNGAYVFASYNSLQGQFASINGLLSGYSIDYAYGSNAFGGSNIALVSAIPEPSAIWLLVGLASAGLGRRSRRQQA
jgi:fibronectin-binding autotransporter adhesin